MPKIFIDAGHGGKDAGAVNGNRYEKDDNLRLALKLRELLVAQGIEVLMSRTVDTNTVIKDFCTQANNAKCDYLLSLHRNSAVATATGIEMWLHSNSFTASIAKAEIIYNAVQKASGYVSRGIKYGMPSKPKQNFGVNSHTTMPSALLEVGFIGNALDNSRYDSKLNDIALSLAKALCEVVGVKYTEKKVTAENVHTVKVGETLSGIAGQYGTTYQKLAEINGNCKS